MLTDQETFRRLLSAVATLEVATWPPDETLVHTFADALDGVTRRFLDDPHASSDGYISRDLQNLGDGIFSAGDLWVLSANARPSPQTRRTEAKLSSARGGWIHVASETDQQKFERQTRRQRAATTRLERWTYTVEVPTAASLDARNAAE